MLINNFFNITSINSSSETINAKITLDASHIIFKGHFPNNPITPGVVQLQLVKEILEQIIEKKLQLKEVGRCKFLAILNPIEYSEIIINIDFQVENGDYKISAQGITIDRSKTFFKFTAKYT